MLDIFILIIIDAMAEVREDFSDIAEFGILEVLGDDRYDNLKA